MLEYAITSLLNDICAPIIGEDKITPIFTIEVPGVTYTDTPISTGIVSKDQVEIKIIHNDIDEGLKLKETILDKFNTKYQDEPLLANDIQIISNLAGGGSIFNDSIQVWELSLIFIMKWRNIK